MSEPALRVLIADDHAVVRDGLTVLLSSHPGVLVVAAVPTGREAVRACVESAPDVVLMDLGMPDLDGIEATRRVRAAAPAVKVLVLTNHDDRVSLVAALRAGASGYLLKTSGLGEITAAIHAVCSGQLTFSSDIADAARGLLVAGDTAAPRPFPELTAREFEMLDLLASGATTERIAQELGVSAKTVSNNLSTIFTKLHVSTRTEAALLAAQRGLGHGQQ